VRKPVVGEKDFGHYHHGWELQGQQVHIVAFNNVAGCWFE
jgi:hypothetical protein